MRKPEIAKKTSTPTKPPGIRRPQVVDDDEHHRKCPEGLDLLARHGPTLPTRTPAAHRAFA